MKYAVGAQQPELVIVKPFLTLARRNVEHVLTKRGIKEIVTSCAGCYRALKFDYPEVPDTPDTYAIPFIIR